MNFVIFIIALACYAALLLKITSRSQKEIICSNCGYKYIVTPSKVDGYTNLMYVVGLVVGFLVLNDVYCLTFGLFFVVSGFYYLLKEEGYKCYNCKTINQLPK